MEKIKAPADCECDGMVFVHHDTDDCCDPCAERYAQHAEPDWELVEFPVFVYDPA